MKLRHRLCVLILCCLTPSARRCDKQIATAKDRIAQLQ